MRPRIVFGAGSDSPVPSGNSPFVDFGFVRIVPAAPKSSGLAATPLKVMPAPKRNSLLLLVLMLQHSLRVGDLKVLMNCFTLFNWSVPHFALKRPYFASLSSMVRYFGASFITSLMNAASCAASTLGGGVVRIATGIPTSLKNSSWPAGEQMQSILTGFDEALWNW